MTFSAAVCSLQPVCPVHPVHIAHAAPPDKADNAPGGQALHRMSEAVTSGSSRLFQEIFRALCRAKKRKHFFCECSIVGLRPDKAGALARLGQLQRSIKQASIFGPVNSLIHMELS